MQKRAIAVFFTFCVAMGMLCLRLYTIPLQIDAASRLQRHNKTITLDTLRLPFLDFEGRPLVNTQTETFAAVKPVEAALAEAARCVGEKDLDTVRASIRSGLPTVCKAQAEFKKSIYLLPLRKYVRYASGTAAHLIGYVNGDGDGVTGLERALDGALKTDISLYAGFVCDAKGRIVTGAEIVTDPRYETCKGGVTLTIDRTLQTIAEEELRASVIKKGAVVLCETATGKIRAMASVPTFDRNNVASYLQDADAPLVNRALRAYAVGSVFKAAVAAAALEHGVPASHTYRCAGSCTLDGISYHCNNGTAHGAIDMAQALACSCNCYFIELARRIGADAVLETARLLGFGETIAVAKGLYADAGRLPTREQLAVSGNLANFAFGQGAFTANPLQVSNLFSCIGSGGAYTLPYAVESIRNADGETVYTAAPKAPVRALQPETARTLTAMLTGVIENGTAKQAKTEGFACAGKTATAQTGSFRADGSEKLCTWFAGFFPADQPRYTIVILREDGVTGGGDCAPVSRAIAERVMEIKK